MVALKGLEQQKTSIIHLKGFTEIKKNIKIFFPCDSLGELDLSSFSVSRPGNCDDFIIVILRHSRKSGQVGGILSWHWLKALR